MSGKQLYVLYSLPRSGSTALAQAFSKMPSMSCMIEPFHPRRYGGTYNRLAEAGDISKALTLMSLITEGFKHVYEADGRFPFKNDHHNLAIIKNADFVIYLRRRNLLERFVSGWLSQRLRFWIGPKEQFLERLARLELPFPRQDEVAAELARDQAAIERDIAYLRELKKPHKVVFYEDLFDVKVSPRQRYDQLRVVLSMMNKPNVSIEDYLRESEPFLAYNHKWASGAIYEALIARMNIGSVRESPIG